MATPIIEDRTLKIAQTAELLSLSRCKVYDMMNNGMLRYIKLGANRRIRLPDLQRLVDQNLRGGRG